MTNPRLQSIEAISRIKLDGAYANLLTNEMLSKSKFSSQDAAFFTDLVNGTVRHLRYLDYVIGKCVSREISDIEPKLLIILEIAAYSYLIKNKASHAVVNEAVESARLAIGERAVGFCNGVLRQLVRTEPEIWLKSLEKLNDFDEALAIKHSIPDWIYEQFKKQIPDSRELDVMLTTLNQPPDVSLLRPPNTNNEMANLRPGNWSAFSYRDAERGTPGSRLMKSDLIVQDEGSQLVSLATILAPIIGPDANWLDMTAGPGGKATFLAAAAKSRGAKLVANELHPHRAKLMSDTFDRLKLNVNVTIGDALTQKWDDKFDRVLLDAPCTGMGALRRRAEARWRKQPDDLVNLVDLQKKLLNRAIGVTRRGGVVCYTTCSLHPRETTEVVSFAMKTSKVELLDASELLPGVPAKLGPFLTLWPHIHGTDGMFMAILKVS